MTIEAFGSPTGAAVEADLTVLRERIEWLSGPRATGAVEHDVPGPSIAETRLGELAGAIGLDALETDLVLVAASPDLGWVESRWTVADALRLVAPGAEVVARRRLLPDAPLIAERLLHLVPPGWSSQPPLLGHQLVPDGQVLSVLLDEATLDPRLLGICDVVPDRVDGLDRLSVANEMRALPDLVTRACDEGRPLCIHLYGLRGTAVDGVAESLARTSGRPLLVARAPRLPSDISAFEAIVQIVLREAWLMDAVLHVAEVDGLRGDDRWDCLVEAVSEESRVVVLSGERTPTPSGRGRGTPLPVRLSPPGAAQRRSFWQRELGAAAVPADPALTIALAERYRLTGDQIAEAVTLAVGAASIAGRDPVSADLFAAARSQGGHALGALARRVDARASWSDLVVPDDARAQLGELCARAAQGSRVLDDWGFGRRLARGRGIAALFSGPPGTGKTMAAEVIANELELELYAVDLAGLVSKWVGETEKNLDRVFSAAERADAVLFFDEADALFGKRSEVRDSRDRYANLEVSYLLQRMELYEGIAILATNLRQNLDDAFARRLAFAVHFPFPDAVLRRRLWSVAFPSGAPLDNDVDLDLLAEGYQLSGGSITKVALAAAFLAAEEEGSIAWRHVLHAIGREHQIAGLPAQDPAHLTNGLHREVVDPR